VQCKCAMPLVPRRERLKCGDGVFFQLSRDARCKTFLALLRLPARPLFQMAREFRPHEISEERKARLGCIRYRQAESYLVETCNAGPPCMMPATTVFFRRLTRPRPASPLAISTSCTKLVESSVFPLRASMRQRFASGAAQSVSAPYRYT
jgi:hypothetical protein